MTYPEALAYIRSVDWRGSRPGLSRIRELADRLGRPQDRLRFIHVAGTNGKGSVSAMIASVLTAAGFRTGLYTSPHLRRVNERMSIGGRDIPDGTFAELVSTVAACAESMEDPPTEFELLTAVSLRYFERLACDFVVAEVGMGGRLDATNLIDANRAAVSVITGISLDHTAFLGGTVARIAQEKAGIIKAGVPVVFGGRGTPGWRDAADVIRARARELCAPYVEVDPSRITVRETGIRGTSLDCGSLRGLHIPLAGAYQPRNAATALAAINVLTDRGTDIPESAVRAGLALTRWPARFELLSDDPPIVADGAHNPEGIAAAVASIRACFGDERVLILSGVMADKDYGQMTRLLAETAERAFTVRPDNPRALDPERYAVAFREAGVRAEAFPSVRDGVRAAVRAARQEGKPLICLGSLYLYGEASEAVADAVREAQDR